MNEINVFNVTTEKLKDIAFALTHLQAEDRSITFTRPEKSGQESDVSPSTDRIVTVKFKSPFKSLEEIQQLRLRHEQAEREKSKSDFQGVETIEKRKIEI